MPRRSLKRRKLSEEKAQHQICALMFMTPCPALTEEELRWMEEELDVDDIVAEIQSRNKEESLESDPNYNPFGRKLLRTGQLEFYQQIHDRVMRGVPRKEIAEDLGVSVHRVKIGLRALRKLTGQDYRNHRHSAQDFNKCRQCRGYVNSAVRSEYDPRRRRKQKEIPASYVKLPGTNQEKLDWLTQQT